MIGHMMQLINFGTMVQSLYNHILCDVSALYIPVMCALALSQIAWVELRIVGATSLLTLTLLGASCLGVSSIVGQYNAISLL